MNLEYQNNRSDNGIIKSYSAMSTNVDNFYSVVEQNSTLKKICDLKPLINMLKSVNVVNVFQLNYFKMSSNNKSQTQLSGCVEGVYQTRKLTNSQLYHFLKGGSNFKSAL